MNLKENGFDYPLKVLQFDNDEIIKPFELLKKYGIVQENSSSYDERQTLLFVDSNDYRSYFDLHNSQLTVIDRLASLETYTDANNFYKILLNSKLWLIHGQINYYSSVRYNEEGNFLLILNTSELYIKNFILNGLRGLLNSFLTHKKYIFEITFEEVLKNCFKRKLEIKHFQKISASKLKYLKTNIVFMTLDVSKPADEHSFYQSQSQRKMNFFSRVRSAVSSTIRVINTNISTTKFALNSLPYLCFQYENNNTFTYFSNNEEKLWKIYKSTGQIYVAERNREATKSRNNLCTMPETQRKSLRQIKSPKLPKSTAPSQYLQPVNSRSTTAINTTPSEPASPVIKSPFYHNSPPTDTSSISNSGDDNSEKIEYEVMCLDNMKIMTDKLQISELSSELSKSDLSENSVLTKVTPKSSEASSFEEHIYEDANIASSDGTSFSETYEENSYNISEANLNNRSGSFSAILKSFSYNNVFFKSDKSSQKKTTGILKKKPVSKRKGIIREGSLNYQNISYEELFQSVQSLPKGQNVSYGYEFRPTQQCSFKRAFGGPHII